MRDVVVVDAVRTPFGKRNGGTPATTIDTQCGSSQQAVNLGHSLIASGAAEAIVACGVEVMSTVKMGSTVPGDGSLGKPVTKGYWKHHEYTSQFEGAERMAEKWGITRADADAFGKLSQDRAAAAQASAAYDTHLVAVDAPVLGDDRIPTGETHTVTADEGVRDTSLDKLATHVLRRRPGHRNPAPAGLTLADNG